jgi:hypothetical protein
MSRLLPGSLACNKYQTGKNNNLFDNVTNNISKIPFSFKYIYISCL